MAQIHPQAPNFSTFQVTWLRSCISSITSISTILRIFIVLLSHICNTDANRFSHFCFLVFVQREGHREPDLSAIRRINWGSKSPKPCIKVDCITHRNNPIFRGSLEGTSPGKWCESPYYVVPCLSAALWNALASVGVPGIVDVWSPPVTCATHVRVRIRKIYRGQAQQVANAIWGMWSAGWFFKHVVVVDEDIDIRDDEAVEWAIAYRVNAGMDDVLFFKRTFGSLLDPSVPLGERDVMKYGQGKWTRVLVDATKNWELGRQEQYGGELYPPLATEIEPDIEKFVKKRWKEYELD